MLSPECTVLPPHYNHRPAYLMSCEEWYERPDLSTRTEIIGNYIPVIFDFSNGMGRALRYLLFLSHELSPNI